MNLSDEQAQARVPVTIVRVQGDVDGSNYRELIERTRAIHQAGARQLLVDLANVPYMSSAGLVALHSITLLFQQKPLPDPEFGWRAIRALGDTGEVSQQKFIKLLGPQPRVSSVLEQTGLLPFFEVYNDEAAALASF